MTDSSPLRILVTDVLKRNGSQRSVQRNVVIDDLATAIAKVEGATALEVTLERVNEGIVARGRVDATWTAACSRCLAPTGAELTVHVDELFETEPVEGETYPIDGEWIDLEPLVRDALVLELPRAPLCRDDCAGLCPTCGTDRNTSACDCAEEASDPRWAALRSLEL